MAIFNKSGWNPFDLSSQNAVEGDANVQGLIGFSKKSVNSSTQNSYQSTDSRDFSSIKNESFIDARAVSSVYSPTLVLNSAGADVSGSRNSPSVSPSVTPSFTTKKEATVEQGSSAESKQSQTEGISTKTILIFGAVGTGVYLLTKKKGKK